MAEHKTFRDLLKIESKDALIYASSTFLTRIGSFLIVPLFWRKLTPYDYGIIAVVELIGTFLSSLLGLSMDSNITRFYYEWTETERRRRIGVLWTVNWSSTIILGCISLLILFFVNRYLFPEVAFYPFVFLGIIGLILDKLGMLPFATIRIKQKPKTFFSLRTTAFAVQMALNIVFVVMLNKGVRGYFISNIIVGIIMAAIYTMLMFRWAVPCLTGAGLKIALRFCLPLIPSQLLSNFSSLFGRFLLQRLIGVESLGIYSVSGKFVGILYSLHEAMKMSFVPFVFKNLVNNSKDGKLVVFKMVSFYLFPLFASGVAITVLMSGFVSWVGQSAYYPVIQYVPFLIAVGILEVLPPYCSLGILLSKRTELTIIPILLQLPFLFAGCLLLIPTYQLYGLIIVRFICAAVFLGASVFISQKVYDWQCNWTAISLFSIVSVGVVLVHEYERKIGSFADVLGAAGSLIIFLLSSILILKFSAKTPSVLGKFS